MSVFRHLDLHKVGHRGHLLWYVKMCEGYVSGDPVSNQISNQHKHRYFLYYILGLKNSPYRLFPRPVPHLKSGLIIPQGYIRVNTVS